MPKSRMVCSVNGEVKEWVRVEAFKRGISMSVLVEKCVRKYKKEMEDRNHKKKLKRVLNEEER